MRPEAPAFTPGPEDIATRIHREIASGSYECMVCYGGVTRKAKIWSCKCCWAVYHLNCIQKWGKQGLEQESRAPIGADGEPPRTWRCPACNNPNRVLPDLYTCWCGKDTQPESNRYTPPHSCGQTCGKQLTNPKKCPHSCTAQCHAGPCAPCTAMGPVQTCFCGKESHQKRCVDTDYEGGWSCGQVCGDVMPCGEHICPKPCHPLLCGSCDVTELVKCYCGNEMKEIKCCDKEDARESSRIHENSDDEYSDDDELDEWTGYYECGKICGRLLACGVHRCKKGCHPQNITDGTCPSDPRLITHCPCGKTSLTDLLPEPRPNCEAPIPTCTKVCNKALACGHPCTKTCHDGECGVCLRKTEIACRCRKTISLSLCHQGMEVELPQCMRNCRATLNCGRHECGEKCCSGEMKAQERLSTKRRMRPLNNTPGLQTDDGFEPEHICTKPCGRLLKCGKHNCSMLCHRGPCGSCLEASFDELTCQCGRTAIQPPVPCGSKPPPCHYPCTRPKSCRHPLVPHDCHPDEEECPKCPYLTEKLCKCGKRAVKAVPCWRESVSCGTLCGKKLSCGSHFCRKLCHDGECEEPCKQLCGKPKATCGHPCLDNCHAPFQCSEDRPCQEKLKLSCSCGGVKQDIKCGATKAKPAGNQKEIPCTDTCRARRLAMALDIDPEREGTPAYSDETVTAYNRDTKSTLAIEQKFRAFAENKDQKHLQFGPMRTSLREFAHLLAADYGLDSESQDPEPYRSVVVRKPVNFNHIPRKTLAEFLAAKPAAAAATPVAVQQLKKLPRGQAVNAFTLRGIRVGILASELEKEISPVLKESQLRFDITWHGDEDVLLKPRTSSLAMDQIEAELHSLSTKLKRVVASKGLAESTELCWVGQDGRIANSAAVAGGWSLANPRKSAPAVSRSNAPTLVSKNGFELFGGAAGGVAKKKSAEKVKPKEVEVVDDWEMEADDI
ncbi:hypothetical protein K440DRAFT_535857 [Wilcoxina mikolae CBS 423.85]|nr:hypothetical protein K440DRAFT_535857 [Wilcoxina mikolae CBS 423.85]